MAIIPTTAPNESWKLTVAGISESMIIMRAAAKDNALHLPLKRPDISTALYMKIIMAALCIEAEKPVIRE